MNLDSNAGQRVPILWLAPERTNHAPILIRSSAPGRRHPSERHLGEVPAHESLAWSPTFWLAPSLVVPSSTIVRRP